MDRENVLQLPAVRELVEALRRALDARLASVVLYGSMARGDFHEHTSDLNVLVVLADLAPPTLELLTAPFARWRRMGHPPPRVFSVASLAETTDVFPVELLDIQAHRVVLHGTDPFPGLGVRRDHLRLQCERELREKWMLLTEAYVECHDRREDLARLLTDSYTTFVALFRGCLHLHGEIPPEHNDEVVAAFCQRSGLDAAPFVEVDRLKRGEAPQTPVRALFARYHAELARAITAVDRFDSTQGGASR